MDADTVNQLKRLIIDVIDEEFCPKPVEIAPKWSGGRLVMHPEGDQQPKEVPIEVLFRKIVGIRDALRVLEQKINTNDKLAPDEKATLHGYVTKCYGSLTTFNVLFKEGKDRFVGSGKGGSSSGGGKPKMSMSEAKARLGMKEYGGG